MKNKLFKNLEHQKKSLNKNKKKFIDQPNQNYHCQNYIQAFAPIGLPQDIMKLEVKMHCLSVNKHFKHFGTFDDS